MKPAVFLLVLQSLFLLLFGYTGFSKLWNLSEFKALLMQTPLLSQGAAALAIATPLAELVIVLLLLFPVTRHWGFWGSGLLLGVFSVYLAVMIWSGVKLPCSCGGLISGMGWREHLVMNVGLGVMAVWGGVCSGRLRTAG